MFNTILRFNQAKTKVISTMANTTASYDSHAKIEGPLQGNART